MCSVCSIEKSLLLNYDQPAFAHFQGAAGSSLSQLRAYSLGSGKLDLTSSSLQGGAEDFKQYDIQTVLIPIPDDVPDTITAANPSITVGGPSVISTINTQGDRDVYSIYLEAGVDYEIGMLSQNAGPSGVALLDAYLVFYDAQGNKLTETDGGSETHALSFALSGLDAMLSVRVQTSGTYYVSATSYDQVNSDGQGDTVGDYQLFARPAQPDTSYKAYYELDSPLHSIDWGTQVNKVHQSVRNPDGQEGPRPTGNVYEVPSGDALGFPGKNVITYYFAKQGELFVDENPATIGLTTTMIAKGMQAWEKDAFVLAFGEYEKVADIVYLEVQNKDEADFVIVTYDGTPGTVGVSLLGRMSAPDEDNEGQTEVNAGDYRWTETGVQKGGFYFGTIVHELGHGHGLAHMHDTGGHSSKARGVESAGITSPSGVNTPGGRVPLPTTVNVPDPTGIYPDYTLGDFEFNQGIYSMMAYQDGWASSPYGQAATSDPYGWLGSLMAFDIAVIQDKYGVNEEWATGNDTYTLKDVNAVGTFFSSIWDAGGTDEIVYDGARDANIELRAATLKYEEGGGGFLSYAWGIHGGFTIANGATIENARSGSGNDKLTGNNAANRLESGAGNDSLTGLGGDDILIGGAGKDSLSGGEGKDKFVFANGDSGTGEERDVIADFTKGSDQIDLGGAGAKAFIGSRAFSGTVGEVRATAGNGITVIQIDQDGDAVADMEVELTGEIQLGSSDLGALIHERLAGTSGNDVLQGFEGNDTLIGLAGNDILDGGEGSDTADYSATYRNFRLDLELTTPQDTSYTGFDTLISIENLIGGSGSNTFYGSAASNRLEGRDGNDLLDGRGGDDFIIGGSGSDHLAGRAGSDTFIFQALSDSTVGNGRDRITDFTSLVDKIDLSLIDAITSTTRDDAFTFIGSSEFTGIAGQLRYSRSSSSTLISGDVDGDGLADFQIALTNNAIPVVTDFIL